MGERQEKSIADGSWYYYANKVIERSVGDDFDVVKEINGERQIYVCQKKITFLHEGKKAIQIQISTMTLYDNKRPHSDCEFYLVDITIEDGGMVLHGERASASVKVYCPPQRGERL